MNNMAIRWSYVVTSTIIVLSSLLLSNGVCFGKYRSTKCKSNVANKVSSSNEIDPHCDCIPREKITLVGSVESPLKCNSFDTHFISACVRCGMCIAIANKLNETLLDTHEVMIYYTTWNEAQAIQFLRSTCDTAFEHYSLREIGGQRYIGDVLPEAKLVSSWADGLWRANLKTMCHTYLNEIGEPQLYNHWLQWFDDDDPNLELVNLLCRNDGKLLKDCKNIPI